MTANSTVYFSKMIVTKQVFYKTKYTYALVNIKPIVPGHILVVPLNNSCLNLCDLSPEENTDFFNTLQVVHRFIKHHFKADSLNVAIQDGPEAGQSIPHLHAHVIPRYAENNIGDKMYTVIDEWDARRDAYGGREARKLVVKPDSERVGRTEEEMFAEAELLQDALQNYIAEHEQELKGFSS